MARGFTLLPIALLLVSVPGFGQGRQSTARALTGIVRNIGDRNVVIEADDKTITTVAIANSTKYIGSSGGSAKIGDFQPGDHVSIGANQDNKNVYHAATMTMVREGTPEEHSIASLAADDTSHPLPSQPSDSSSGTRRVVRSATPRAARQTASSPACSSRR